jgi:hypothetical protein
LNLNISSVNAVGVGFAQRKGTARFFVTDGLLDPLPALP